MDGFESAEPSSSVVTHAAGAELFQRRQHVRKEVQLRASLILALDEAEPPSSDSCIFGPSGRVLTRPASKTRSWLCLRAELVVLLLLVVTIVWSRAPATC
jgi:hypothetical protein